MPVYATASASEDWDRYEALQWSAAARFAAANPDDTDLVELLSRVGANRAAYLKWGRDTLGWGIYVFRR